MEKIIGPYSRLDSSILENRSFDKEKKYLATGAYGEVFFTQTEEYGTIVRKEVDSIYDDDFEYFQELKGKLRLAKIPHLDFSINNDTFYSTFLNQSRFVALSNNTISHENLNLLKIPYLNKKDEIKNIKFKKVKIEDVDVLKRLVFDLLDIFKKASENNILFSMQDMIFFIVSSKKKEQKNIIPIVADYDTVEIVNNDYGKKILYKENFYIIKDTFDLFLNILSDEDKRRLKIDALSFNEFKKEWVKSLKLKESGIINFL